MYSTEKLAKLSTPLHDVASRGIVSTVAWLSDPTGGDAHETLCFGTQLGWIAIWKQGEGVTSHSQRLQARFAEVSAECVSDGAEIMSLAADTEDKDHYRLALGTQSMVVQTWIIKNKCLSCIFSIKLENTIPKTVMFRGNANHDLLVFGMIDGHM